MKIEVTISYSEKKHRYNIAVLDLQPYRQNYLNRVFFYLGGYLKGNLSSITMFSQVVPFEEKRVYHCKNTARNQAAYIFKFIETTKNLYR